MGCNGICRKKKFKAKNKSELEARPCQVLCGILNGQEQNVPRAELEPIAQVLENGMKPLCIHSDQMNLVTAIRLGKGYCCEPTMKHADIWRRIWKQIDRMGGVDEQLQVKCVKSRQK